MDKARNGLSKTPKVQGQQLYLPACSEPVCPIDSAIWFAWVETAVTFRYPSPRRLVVVRGYGPLVSPISLRKEKRRQGALWYAYRRNHGLLHKRYVGKSEALTSARLDEVAIELSLAW